MKRRLTSLEMKAMSFQTTERYILGGWNLRAWHYQIVVKGMEQQELILLKGALKISTTLKNNFASPSKKCIYFSDPAILFLETFLVTCTKSQCAREFIIALFVIAKYWK